MPTVKFIERNGTEHVVPAEVGDSVMQVAINNLVPGIFSDCGGGCICAGCHAYVDEAWVPRLQEAQELEADMLTCVEAPRPNSRLTCQIKITPELDGLVIHMASA